MNPSVNSSCVHFIDDDSGFIYYVCGECVKNYKDPTKRSAAPAATGAPSPVKSAGAPIATPAIVPPAVVAAAGGASSPKSVAPPEAKAAGGGSAVPFSGAEVNFSHPCRQLFP